MNLNLQLNRLLFCFSQYLDVVYFGFTWAVCICCQVKRVLRTGGTFVCLTLAESHVLGMLFISIFCRDSSKLKLI